MEKYFVVFAVLVSACSGSAPNPETDRSKDANGFFDEGSAAQGGSTVSLVDATDMPSDNGSDGGASDADVPDSSDADVPSDAGSDATTDAEAQDAGNDADVVEPECPGSGPGTKCEGLTRFACVGGQWEAQEVCDHVCQAGACVGVCEPGDKDCSGNHPRDCNANGEWDVALECSFVCSAGDCIGACVPGDRDCSGDVPRQCNGSGQWVNESACSYLCGGEGVCSGVCEPGDRDCSGDVPRQCNASGQWVNETACPYICGGEGVCSGSCEPTSTSCSGDIPQTCNSAGQWVNGAACTFVCSAGSCTGVCEPGDRDCSGDVPRSCNAQGQWVAETACPFLCSGEGVCSGSCEPGDGNCSGDIPRSCNSAGAWVNGTACQFVCSGEGSCTGVCEPGEVQCSGQQIQTCGSNGEWQTATNCPATAGATSYCMANTCTFDCQLDFDDCDSNPANGCEVNLNTNADNCGQCGHSCCGGTCGSGTCGLNTTGIVPWNNAFTVDSTHLYWSAGSDLNKKPRTGGATVAVASNQPSVIGLTVSDSTVYWGTAGNMTTFPGIFSKSVNGGSTTTYGNVNGDHIVVTPNDILFRRNDLATISYWDRSNDSTSPALGGTSTYAAPFVSDGSSIYATYISHSSNQKPIVQVPVHGGTVTAFASYTPTNPTAAYSHAGLSTDGTNLYYVMYIGSEPTKAGVWKKPLTGGSATQLVTSGNGFSGTTATDGTNVYFADVNTRQVRKANVSNGSAQTLTTLPGSSSYTFSNMKVVNECLYWTGTSGIQSIAVNP